MFPKTKFLNVLPKIVNANCIPNLSDRLTVPMPTLDCSTGKAVSVFPVSQAANVKNKDGNGNKRKNRGNSLSEQVTKSKKEEKCTSFKVKSNT